MNLQHLFFKKDIKKYVVSTILILLALWLATTIYWSPRNSEHVEGMCVTRLIGHGTFISSASLSSSGDWDWTLTPLKSADYKTLQYVYDYYCKDKTHVYFAGKILEGIDPSNFNRLNYLLR